jgi:predicted ATPase
VLPPRALLARLDRRLAVLTGGRRDAPARQQTLRAALDWSHALLTPREQDLFARLAVFAGGCTLEAAEAVCGPGLEPPVDVLDGLDSLVEKSLLRQEASSAVEPRFVMLETVREYALERLETDRDREAVRKRHSQCFVQVAEEAEERLRGPGQQALFKRFDDEHANLRAALAWLLEHHQTQQALQIVAGIWRFWMMRGYLREGQRWSEQVLAQADQPPSLLRAHVMAILGEFYRFQGDFERAARVKEQALPVLRCTDQRRTAATLHDLGEIAQAKGKTSAP